MGGVETKPIPYHGRQQSLSLTLPPLGIVFLKSPAAEESNSADVKMAAVQAVADSAKL